MRENLPQTATPKRGQGPWMRLRGLQMKINIGVILAEHKPRGHTILSRPKKVMYILGKNPDYYSFYMEAIKDNKTVAGITLLVVQDCARSLFRHMYRKDKPLLRVRGY